MYPKTSVFVLMLFVLPRTLIRVHCETFPNGTTAYPALRSNTIDRRKPADASSQDSNEYPSYRTRCTSCVREEIKNRNIQMIKSEVLKKMGFEKPPNMTGKVLPRVPSQILSMIETDTSGWQADQPQYHSYSDEEDDFHVKTEKVIVFAQACK